MVLNFTAQSKKQMRSTISLTGPRKNAIRNFTDRSKKKMRFNISRSGPRKNLLKILGPDRELLDRATNNLTPQSLRLKCVSTLVFGIFFGLKITSDWEKWWHRTGFFETRVHQNQARPEPQKRGLGLFRVYPTAKGFISRGKVRFRKSRESRNIGSGIQP